MDLPLSLWVRKDLGLMDSGDSIDRVDLLLGDFQPAARSDIPGQVSRHDIQPEVPSGLSIRNMRFRDRTEDRRYKYLAAVEHPIGRELSWPITA